MQQDLLVDGKAAVEHGPGVWLWEPVREMTIFTEQYDFAISLLLLDDAEWFEPLESGDDQDAYEKMAKAAQRRDW